NMAMELNEVLSCSHSRDANIWNQTEETLKQFEEQDLPSFLLSLSAELANDEKPAKSRKSAGFILRDVVDAYGQHRKPELVQRWLSLDGAVKSQIKSSLMNTLSSLEIGARSTASLVIAKIAGIECPEKHWPELIGSLCSNVDHDQLPSHVKQARLETLGYFGEEVSPDVLDREDVERILTALVWGIRGSDDEEVSREVRVAAIRALCNSLSFAQKAAHFSDCILEAVFEAAQSQDMEIREASFECLVSISSMYYEKLGPYIQGLLIITSNAVKEDDDESVIIQAIEFWSSICVKERHILKDGHDTCFYLVKQALPALVPILLEALLTQERDHSPEEEPWNSATAGGECLSLVARTVGDDVVPLVTPFIEGNITSCGWRGREAATNALGSILEGPSVAQLTPIVNVVLDSMLTALIEDKKMHVRDTTAKTLGRIFKFLHSGIISEENCKRIVPALLRSMDDAQELCRKREEKTMEFGWQIGVAGKACVALYFLAKGYKDSADSCPLTPYFEEIVQSLLTASRMDDAGGWRLRIHAYETLNEVVRCSGEETAYLISRLVEEMKDELLKSLEGTDRVKWSLLCGSLRVIIEKLLGSSDQKTKIWLMNLHADDIMTLFLRVLGYGRSQLGRQEEAIMLGIGALARAAGPSFGKYMPELFKHLETGLRTVECCNQLQYRPAVKPRIFGCLGNIALAMGPDFDKYLTLVLEIAAGLSAQTEGGDEMIEYKNRMRSGILEAYSGILGGFKNTSKSQLLIPYGPSMVKYLESIYKGNDMDASVMKAAIGVIGDLADTLGRSAVSWIQQSDFCKDLWNECLPFADESIKESTERAKLAIIKANSV
ncbi:Importin subunit beta-1, partial [Linum grandiflorum]